MIEIYLLEQLVAFARHGTLLRASEELHITQPALSRNMKKLEEEFGVSLFHRENSKISLNDNGKLAVEYAGRVLEDDQDMVDRVRLFDRAQRTISIGACTPFPLWEIMPSIQNNFAGNAITSEIADDSKLLDGLKTGYFQLIILHKKPDDSLYYIQRYLEENLYVTLPESNPLSKRKSLSFSDLEGKTMLVNGNTGFWLNIVKKHLNPDHLLIQKDLNAMDELVDESTLPFFNSDSMITQGYEIPGRVSIPLTDEDAHAIYYIVCLNAEKDRFRSVFNDAGERVLRGKH